MNATKKEQQTIEFLTKLKELLISYDVSIEFNVGRGSDTHGIHDESMSIVKNKGPWETIFETSGWEITALDIEEELHG